MLGKRHLLCVTALVVLLAAPTLVLAQFNGSIAGLVQDSSGAIVPNASLTLLNPATQITLQTKSDAQGNYRFVSLGPASYRLTAEATGFASFTVIVLLESRQIQNVPVSLAVGVSTTTVQVSTQAPLLDTSETRNELTLPTQALSQLPIPGHNMISLVTYAPGVVGTGASGNQTTGSAGDNYAPENQVSASANGRGSIANLYVVDGLDVTSGIRPGVLNVVPNADSIQESAVQVNTYDVDYGRASSLEVILATKSGSDRFHGRVSDFYTSQGLSAGTEFVKNLKPYHSNDISATIGGPLIPHHQAFFFFAYQTLRSTTTTGNSTTTVDDPAFLSFAQANYPNSYGTKFLTAYRPTLATITGVAKTAAQLFPTTCGTAATKNLPCTTPLVDNATYNATNVRNGTQYNGRLDKYFPHDRIYGSVYYTTLGTSTANIRPSFGTTSSYSNQAIQVNEAHTFSSNTLNEAAFGYVRIEGNAPQTGLFSVPVANISGLGAGFGSGSPNTNYIQHNFHWRDTLTHVYRTHSFKFGYDAWKGNEVGIFQAVNSQPVFTYNNLIDLVNDAPYTETGIAFNPLTGQPTLANFSYGSSTAGAFVEDSWRARKNLTINYGVRWDNFGNPYPRNGTPLANFYLGSGSTVEQQIANGNMVQTSHFFAHSISNIWSPRAGLSWDPTGTGRLVIKGGAGLYRDWPTLGISDQRLKANPPSYITPVFYSGTSTPPVLSVGSSNTYPFGFNYPSLPAKQLDSHGGLVGYQISVGGIDPALRSPVTYIYSASADAQLPFRVVGSVGYSGSHSDDLLTGSGLQTTVSWGDDVNRVAGDLIVHNGTLTRLNPSFGSLGYIRNGAYGNYNALLTSLRGRFARNGFFSVAYTYSHSADDSQVYPTAFNIANYYGPSVWDAPNRFSLLVNYQLPGTHSGHFVDSLSQGWSVSAATILQSGTPFVVSTSASFQPTRDANGVINGLSAASGDYNADGRNFDFPSVSSYSQATDRQSYLKGIFKTGQFTQPTIGTEGNEAYDRFRNPGYADTDLGVRKDIKIIEGLDLQLRVDAFNVFNRPNLGGVTGDLSSSSFGKSTSQLNSRYLQLGAALNF